MEAHAILNPPPQPEQIQSGPIQPAVSEPDTPSSQFSRSPQPADSTVNTFLDSPPPANEFDVSDNSQAESTSRSEGTRVFGSTESLRPTARATQATMRVTKPDVLMIQTRGNSSFLRD